MAERASASIRALRSVKMGKRPIRLVERQDRNRAQGLHLAQAPRTSRAPDRAVTFLPALHQEQRVEIPQENPLGEPGSPPSCGLRPNPTSVGERIHRARQHPANADITSASIGVRQADHLRHPGEQIAVAARKPLFLARSPGQAASAPARRNATPTASVPRDTINVGTAIVDAVA